MSYKMFSRDAQKNKKLLVFALAMLLLVGGAALLTWDRAGLRPGREVISLPTHMQTSTKNVGVDPTLIPEVIATGKPAITTLGIESISSAFFVREGIDEPGFEGTAALLPQMTAAGPSYTLDYKLPENDKGAYVNLVFSFEPEQDLSDFGFLQITIDFGGPDTSCKIYLKDVDDTSQTANYVSLGPVLSNEAISVFKIGEDKYMFTIPIKEGFPDSNLSALV